MLNLSCYCIPDIESLPLLGGGILQECSFSKGLNQSPEAEGVWISKPLFGVSWAIVFSTY